MRTARSPALSARLETLVAGEPELRRAAELARSHRCRILLVGGAVRDLALGRPLQDLDFILEGRSAGFLRALSRMLGHRVVTFRKRGIVDHRIRVDAREWDFVERGGRSLRQEILRRDFLLGDLKAVTALAGIAGTVVVEAARRVQDAVVWKRDEHGSAARWLASTTGVSVGSAARGVIARSTACRVEVPWRRNSRLGAPSQILRPCGCSRNETVRGSSQTPATMVSAEEASEK